MLERAKPNDKDLQAYTLLNSCDAIVADRVIKIESNHCFPFTGTNIFILALTFMEVYRKKLVKTCHDLRLLYTNILESNHAQPLLYLQISRSRIKENY